MGADWYYIEGFYGYKIKINPYEYSTIIAKLLKIIDVMDKQFEFAAVLSQFHSRMEGMSDDELKEMYENNATLIIGFRPHNNLSKTMKMAEKLKNYIKNNNIFSKIQFFEHREFFYGKDVFDSMCNLFYDEEEDDDDSDLEDDSDLDDDSDLEDEEEEEDDSDLEDEEEEEDDSDLEDEEDKEDEDEKDEENKNNDDVDTSQDECKVVPITEMTKCTL